MSFKDTPMYRYAEPDVILVVGENEIKVHEYVLASQSDFFNAAFRSGLKESKEKRIDLSEIEPEILNEILNWLYRIPITPPFLLGSRIDGLFDDGVIDKITQILRGFDFLQIQYGTRDYVKHIEDHVERETRDSDLPFASSDNFVTLLNEIYKSRSSMSEKSLIKLLDACYFRKNTSYSTPFQRDPIDDLYNTLNKLEDPNGRCFRDVSAALLILLYRYRLR